MSEVILIGGVGSHDPISAMIERIRDEKERGITIVTNQEHADNVKDIIINVGTVGHCDWTETIMETMEHAVFGDLGIVTDLNILKEYKNQDECQGNFKKVTKGNRHTYPHWHQGKY